MSFFWGMKKDGVIWVAGWTIGDEEPVKDWAEVFDKQMKLPWEGEESSSHGRGKKEDGRFNTSWI